MIVNDDGIMSMSELGHHDASLHRYVHIAEYDSSAIPPRGTHDAATRVSAS